LFQGYADQNKPKGWSLALPTGEARDRSVYGYVVGVLKHAEGSGMLTEDKFNDAVVNLPYLPDMIQNSSLDEQEKQRLIPPDPWLADDLVEHLVRWTALPAGNQVAKGEVGGNRGK